MRRSDICFAVLSPTVGTEINKKRPVLVVSNDVNNKHAPMVTVVPLTSNTSKVYPGFEVFLAASETGLKKDSKALCQQIKSISKKRLLTKKVGDVSCITMRRIDNALKVHLNLN